MATDKKISELAAAPTIAATDISVLVKDGVDYQYNFSQLIDHLAANLTVGAKMSFGTTLPQNNTGKNGDVFLHTGTGSIYQKINGTWANAYTPASPATGGNTILYDIGAPANTTGTDGDSYINITNGIFYKKAAGTWAQVFAMANGPAGLRGNSLLNGMVNPADSIGLNGDFYFNTTALTIFGPKTDGVWPAGVSINGNNGRSLLNGSGIPSNSLGNNGDFYLDIFSYKIYGPKANNDWPDGISIIGPAGEQGEPGEQGAEGPKGDTGATGAAGAPGTNGVNGQGVPTGGSSGQVLAKTDGGDYHTEWIDPPETAAIADGLVSGGEASISGQVITIAPAAWRINGIAYSTTVAKNFTLSNADAVNSRYDIIYGNSLNQLLKIEGSTSANPVKPSIPADTVEIATAYVQPGSIGTIATELANYATKQDVKSITGDKADLQTAATGNLVEAINEVRRQISQLNQDQITIKAFKYSNYR